jgi:glycosyltransferase involved in cell wall biosynthesis
VPAPFSSAAPKLSHVGEPVTNVFFGAASGTQISPHSRELTLQKIAIVEPSAAGHQMIHAAAILAACCDAQIGSVVFLTTAEGLAHPSAAAVRAMRDDGRFEVRLLDKRRQYPLLAKLHPALQQQFVYSHALRAFFAEESDRSAYAHVFIPFFDAYALWPLGLLPISFGGIKVSGIVHRTKFHLPKMNIDAPVKPYFRAEEYIYRWVLNRKDITRIFTVDPFLPEYVRSRKLSFLPDPASFQPSGGREVVRARLGIPDGAFTLLVYGFLDSRKAVGPLLEALARPEIPTDVCVVLAGVQTEEIRRQVASPLGQSLIAAGRLKNMNFFIPPEDEDDLFLAADLAWVCYINSDGNSGVLVKAGRAARPVISAPTGIVGRLVREKRLGWIADPRDSAAIAKAIVDAHQQRSVRAEASANIARAFEAHTLPRFLKPIIEHLTSSADESTRTVDEARVEFQPH